MSIKAYFMCKVSSGLEREVCNKMLQFVSVEEAEIIFGEYDIMVKLIAKNLDELDFVTEEIRNSIPGILFSFTAIIAREYKGKKYRGSNVK